MTPCGESSDWQREWMYKKPLSQRKENPTKSGTNLLKDLVQNLERRCCQKRRGSSIYLHCTWAKNTQSIVSFQTLQRDFVLLGEDRKKKNLHTQIKEHSKVFIFSQSLSIFRSLLKIFCQKANLWGHPYPNDVFRCLIYFFDIWYM